MRRVYIERSRLLSNLLTWNLDSIDTKIFIDGVDRLLLSITQHLTHSSWEISLIVESLVVVM